MDFISAPPEDWTIESWVMMVEIGIAVAIVCLSRIGAVIKDSIGPFVFLVGAAAVLAVAIGINVGFYCACMTHQSRSLSSGPSR